MKSHFYLCTVIPTATYEVMEFCNAIEEKAIVQETLAYLASAFPHFTQIEIQIRARLLWCISYFGVKTVCIFL